MWWYQPITPVIFAPIQTRRKNKLTREIVRVFQQYLANAILVSRHQEVPIVKEDVSELLGVMYNFCNTQTIHEINPPFESFKRWMNITSGLLQDVQGDILLYIHNVTELLVAVSLASHNAEYKAIKRCTEHVLSAYSYEKKI
jgi:hypothetical protein